MSATPVQETERFVGHKIHLQVFEGPLDLLLYLVRAHRYDICDIPIHNITAQFVEYLTLMREVEADYAGDFLVTAATLMQIKARMLLPRAQSQNEEVMDEESVDPRAELVEQLLELQRIQDAAADLKQKREEWADIFRRPILASKTNLLGDEDEQLSLGEVSSFDLLSALKRVLKRMEEAPVALVKREPFTLPERLKAIANRIQQTQGGATFEILCDDCTSRLEVVITFLAVLELIKRARLKVRQLTLFDEIYLERL